MAGIMEKMYGNQGGGSGGDSHNKGSFLTPAALREAYPTAEPGDFAIVESTDTVWVWDNDGSDWKDADQKGQVTSVNGQTGAVTVQATLVNQDNIKSVNGNSLLGSGNLELSTYLTYPAGWTTTGTTKAFCDAVAADTSAVEGKAYLGEVTFSDLPASMANGEVVVEIMDGTTAANKVIVLTLTSGNTAPYMWKYTYWNGGTDVSGWQTWATSAQGAKADTAVQPSDLATVATTGAYSDLTGTPTIPAAQVNSDWNASTGVAEILNKPTLATVATSGAYSDLTGTPTIPAAIQVSTMPTAAVGELDKIYQFIGTTDANYTNGYFYKCVSDGQDPATYSWTQTDVQPQAGGLPDQTGQSGKVLTTNGTDASWSDKPLTNSLYTSTQSIGVGSYSNQGNYAVCVGRLSTASIQGVTIGYKAVGGGVAIGYQVAGYLHGIAIGSESKLMQSLYDPEYSIAIGHNAKAYSWGNIQIGSGTNNEAAGGTFYVALSQKNNPTNNYKMLDYDGTIPTDRFTTTPSADGTYIPTLTISSGVATRSWAAPSGGGSTALSLTLAAANWSNNTITVTATGVTASNNVIVSPAPASQSAYTTAGVMCTAQAADSLTFTCTTTPSSDLTVTVLII